jgi:hypothetical protein
MRAGSEVARDAAKESGACLHALLSLCCAAGCLKTALMPRKQRLKDDDEDEEDDELPSGLLPSRKIARKPRKQRLKAEDEEEDDELALPSRKIANKPRKQRLKDEENGEDVVELPHRPRGKECVDDETVAPPTSIPFTSKLALGASGSA